MSLFEGCWDRIDRAEAHLKAIRETWNSLRNEDLYSFGVNVNRDGTGAIYFVPVDALPKGLSLQLGEFLYHLRAALDGCVYAAAVSVHGNPPPNEEGLEFPICARSSDYHRGTRKIDPLPEKCRTFIETIQPYNAPDLPPMGRVFNFNRTLRILHDWARKDRHRRLHLVGSLASSGDPLIDLPDGVVLKSIDVRIPSLLDHEAEIASFVLKGYQVGMEIKANPNIFVDIAVNEIPEPSAPNDTLANRMIAMVETVRFVTEQMIEGCRSQA